MQEPKHILVRAPNWIGDAVLAQDFFYGLRSQFPEARLVVACPGEMAELFSNGPYTSLVDEVLVLTRKQRKVPTGIGFWRGLARRRFDLAFTLASSLSAGFFLWLSGAPTRIGYADPVAAFFLTHPIAWKGRHSGQHKAQLYRALLAEVGAPTPQRPFPLREPAPGSIILAPGASIALREWPGFVELAQQLRKLYPQSVIRVVGTHAQRAWEARFAALNDPAVESFIGLTTLSELLELCREAQLVVANDSGVAHLAATLAGAPTVVIFGPGDPAYVAPQGPHVRIARAEGVACSPCESARCHARLGYQLCLRQLRVEEVLRQISSLG